MIAVTGVPIFMLMGRSSAIVAAGPSPGRTPTAVPRAQPISPHMRLIGVAAIWNPCQSPAKSNIVQPPVAERVGTLVSMRR